MIENERAIKTKKLIISLIALLVIAGAAVTVMHFWVASGNNPYGSDTMYHIYRGNMVYQSIREGNWYPLYDQHWYNGVENMRYWAPLPAYFMALCQAIGGGNEFTGFVIFIGAVFFFGAVNWLYIGYRKDRVFMGAFLGILWFFMPNNLWALFGEGNLPRAMAMIWLPLLFYHIYEYVIEDKYKNARWAVISYIPVVLCHTGYALMIYVSVALLLLIFRLVYKKKRRALPLRGGLMIPYVLIGIWFYPSLVGGITSGDSSETMSLFFQNVWTSLDPLRRITKGFADFYFGFAAFLLGLFGTLTSRRKTTAGFLTALIIFMCTTTAMYPVISILPGSQYLWMLRFISIALCMILMSFLYWKTLRRWIMLVFCVLLALDAVPSLTLIYGGNGMDKTTTAEEKMEQIEETTLYKKARQITVQRMALLDEGAGGATAAYLTVDYNGDSVQQTFGAGWEAAQTRENIKQVNMAVKDGYYVYAFDRLLELGNDTVLVRISCLNKEEDVSDVTEAAEKNGFTLIENNGSFLLYHRDVEKELGAKQNFGETCQYNGIGIGSTVSRMAKVFPDMEEGSSEDLSDYTYEQLSKYKLIYLSGFTYRNKSEAENLLIRLSENGVRVVINGDGIPTDKHLQQEEFLGVSCHPIVFENGYPILYTDSGENDCALFDHEYKNWKTNYFNGLDNVEGYLYENNVQVAFMGTVKNDNIYFVGLNLTYHYSLTQDPVAGKILQPVVAGYLRDLPDRQLVPLSVKYSENQIVVESPEDGVNTTLSYHTIFHSDSVIENKRNLTYVNQGTTTIELQYPYFYQGLAISLLGLLLLILYFIFIPRTVVEIKEKV